MGVINDNIARRRFLSSAFMTLGMALGLGTLGGRFLQFLMPTVAEKEFSEILVGQASDIPKTGVKQMEIMGAQMALMNTSGGIVAFSRKCTDLGCLISWNGTKEQFICPCHNGIYDKNGKNISGPPPRPLDRYEVIQKGENIYVKVETA